MPIPFIVKNIKGLYVFKQNERPNLFARLAHFLMQRKARWIYSKIGNYLKLRDRIVDIGIGAGGNSCFLLKKGFQVKGVDMADLSIYRDLKAQLYDGKCLPFRDKEFEVALLIHVLHHCESPEQTLKEAKRVAKRVIFIEDTYRHPVEKLIVSINDMGGNFEFWFHPYKTVDEWREFIKKNGWQVVDCSSWSELPLRTWLYGRYCLFVVE